MENEIRHCPCLLLCKLAKVRGEKSTLEININQCHLTQIQFKSHASGHGSGEVHIIIMLFIVCELGWSFELIILWLSWFSETTLHSWAPNSTESRNNIHWKIISFRLPTLLGTWSLEISKMDSHWRLQGPD